MRLDREPQILLVTAKRDWNQWILPKGHIEEGEAPFETAIREVREEAGVESKLLHPEYIGTAEFLLGEKSIRVQYFLLQYTGTVDSGDGRLQRWCTYDEAVELTSFENLRELLRAAWLLVSSV